MDLETLELDIIVVNLELNNELSTVMEDKN